MRTFGQLQRNIVNVLQRRTAELAYWWYSTRPPRRVVSWVVGPEESAGMVGQISNAIPGAYSAIGRRHAYGYTFDYDYEGPNSRLPWTFQRLTEAWHFGKLVAQSEGFIFVGQGGFLRAQNDARGFELEFLKARGRKIICYFVGSDIRSIRMMAERDQRTGMPNVATYLPYVVPITGTNIYDDRRRKLAETADSHADVIISATADQAGYLTRRTEPFLYFYPDERVTDTLEKFGSDGPLVVVHAPSSPIIKGTPLVRAAVAELRAEGLEFEYVELIGVPHEEVERQLCRAHVVLNQFYGFLPGVFGVEAMAAGAVVLMSADEHEESDLPAGSNNAWMVTKHYEVTTRLREVLGMTSDEMRSVAVAGQDWVRAHATATISNARLTAILMEIGNGMR